MNHEHGGGKRHHKDLQVCRQVFDALTCALAELDEPRLDGVVLASVDPAPSAARVLVTFAPTRDDTDLEAALACLHELRDELREEVAAEVHRRRVPELVFRIDRSDRIDRPDAE